MEPDQLRQRSCPGSCSRTLRAPSILPGSSAGCFRLLQLLPLIRNPKTHWKPLAWLLPWGRREPTHFYMVIFISHGATSLFFTLDVQGASQTSCLAVCSGHFLASPVPLPLYKTLLTKCFLWSNSCKTSLKTPSHPL